MRLASLALSALGLAGAGLLWWWLAATAPPVARIDTAGRLALAAASLLPGVAVLAAMIIAQIGIRFVTGAFDPTRGEESRALRVNQRAITNTVEQLAVFAPSLVALTAAVDETRLAAALALGAVFATARLAFWVGYALHPVARAPGMAASGACGLAALAWAIAVWA